MNKKRKILTLVALVVFGVIIVRHYGNLPWDYQRFYYFSVLVHDVLFPLFALAVVYAGLFFIFGGKDTEPVPRRPRNWRRIKSSA